MISATWVRVFFADQMIVHRRQRQQAGDRRVLSIHAAVGKNQQRVAGLDGERCAPAQALPSARSRPVFAVSRAEQRRQRGRQEDRPWTRGAAFPDRDWSDRMRQLQRVAVLRRFVEMLRSVPM